MRSGFHPLVSLNQQNRSLRQTSVSRLWHSRRNTALFCAGCLALLSLAGCEKKEEKPQAGPPDVLVSEVVQQNVPIFQEWVAQLNGPVNADITPKVQGYLLKQAYQNGYFVKKGQLLFELDPRQYQAAVEQSKAVILRWLRKTPYRRSSSTPISPTKPQGKRKFSPSRPHCKMQS
jgi:multidrug efflux pump subunit AcrA (membrane-fusion protein)